MSVSKFYHTPLTPPKGSKVKYFNFAITEAVVNIFSKILHAGRGVNDIKHIKRDFSLFNPQGGLGGGAKAKMKFLRNMVMLHIKLKLMTHAATW